MWNGRWLQAVKRMHTIYDAVKRSLETVTPADRERLHRFRQHLYDLHEYLKNNWKSLTNYAYAYRHGPPYFQPLPLLAQKTELASVP
jgi:hypothetical protein